jgi:PelA/Pel-15E family pectate lyase
LLFCGALGAGPLRAQQPQSALRDEAVQALKKAASYYRDKVASHGGYVYYYSSDLQQRWGEGKTSADTIFVQPPGTPTVGMAYLKAHAATGDRFYLDAARETAEALVYGQLQSGGWTQVIHFARPEKGRMGKYRNGKGGNWNVSSLDDGQTQAALGFLIRADQALDFKHAAIHDAAAYGLDALLKAQFPSGGFPQVWTGPVERKPVVKARFPGDDWKTEGKVRNYWDYYTLNDNVAGTVSDTLIVAHQVYKDRKYRAALEKLGNFLTLAQMPDPQPGWCQQYNYEMVPIWARRFEPPAITAWESQDVMEALIKIARYTGEKKYLEPIPKALEYFNRKCLLPDGKVARYYEFKTNKPLYMDKSYRLTYDDSAVPGHYGWKQPARFEEIEKAYKAVKSGAADARAKSARDLEENVRRILKELDSEGRWITTYAGEHLVGQPKFERGFRYISSEVFSRNVETLSEYITSLRK